METGAETYGDLYLYIEKKFATRTNRNNKKHFYYTKKFLSKYDIPNPSRIIQVLSDFGASSDLEILWNAADKINDNTLLTKDIETPVEFALRNEYYTKWHEGMWVRCNKNDIGAMPDLNTAYIRMEIWKNDE
jgi:hypothetical protein